MLLSFRYCKKQFCQLHWVSAGFEVGGTWFLFISYPSSQVCGNARQIQDLGPCLLFSIWRKEWMPVVAQTFLQLGLHFKPWGLLPYP